TPPGGAVRNRFARLLAALAFGVQEAPGPADADDPPPCRGRLLHFRRGAGSTDDPPEETAFPRPRAAQARRPHADDPRGHRRRHRGLPRCRRRNRGPRRHAYTAEDRPGSTRIPQEGELVAKPNYSYEKRQREIAKKKKKEAKEAKKREAKGTSPDAGPGQDGQAGLG